MSLSHAAIVGASATAAALFVKHEASSHQSTERLAAAALETLLNAIDANDAVTGAHVRRTAIYAGILAEELELPEHDRTMVERVALFHDIGKIHEALFDITHDNKALTREERLAVLTHPQRGAEVLAPLAGFYPDLPEGVLSHHEHWDGSGYPRKLRGRRIPLTARITAVADTFDAVTHSRRYRAGRSASVALDVILEGRGTQFDPELVDLFAFPPVFDRVLEAMQVSARWRTPVRQRRTGRDEENVPDVTFRWRPGRHGARGRPASDQPRHKGR